MVDEQAQVEANQKRREMPSVRVNNRMAIRKKCQVKDCTEKKHIQYLLVHNHTKPQKEQHKEYYCQKHLRMRAAELEFMRLAGKTRKETND